MYSPVLIGWLGTVIWSSFLDNYIHQIHGKQGAVFQSDRSTLLPYSLILVQVTERGHLGEDSLKVLRFYFVLLLYISRRNRKGMETSVLTSKGQLLIPKRLRNKYGIKSGVKVAFIETDKGLILKAMDEAYFDQFAGLLKEAMPSTTEFKKWKSEEKEKEAPEKKFKSSAKRNR